MNTLNHTCSFEEIEGWQRCCYCNYWYCSKECTKGNDWCENGDCAASKEWPLVTRTVYAPFDKQQCLSLNEYQFNNDGLFHEFTCANSDQDWHPQTILVATESGWQCPIVMCDYFQLWAWDWMANWKWLSLLEDEEQLPKG